MFSPFSVLGFFLLCLNKVSSQAVLFDKKRFQILSFFLSLWCVVVLIEGLQGLFDTRVVVFVARDG